MKFGIFYEHQLPRPWDTGSELQLFQDALSQVELADRIGIDFAWERSTRTLLPRRSFSALRASGRNRSGWVTASF